MTEDTPEKLQIDWIRAVAGALAAVASAVLLSTLGAAGTIIGAAIGSLVVTVGSAMFTRGISTSKRKIAKTQKGAAQKIGIAQAEVLRAARADDTTAQESHLDHADERLAEAREDLDEAIVATSPASWRERLSRLPWKRIGLTTLALFVVSLVVITAFELSPAAASPRSPAAPTPATPRSGRRPARLRTRGPAGPHRPAERVHQPERGGGPIRRADRECCAVRRAKSRRPSTHPPPPGRRRLRLRLRRRPRPDGIVTRSRQDP